MYWTTMSTRKRVATVAVGLTGVAIFALVRESDPPPALDAPVRPGTSTPVESALRFRPWSDPTGRISADLPEGWAIEGGLGPAQELGQWRIQATSLDGRSLITLGHNWVSYMEFTEGPYQPGTATIERFLLPSFLQQRGFTSSRVVFRTPTKRISMPSAAGLAIPFDSGTIGILLVDGTGRYSLATAMAETTYLAVPNTPGLWRLRLFATAVAPADPQSQADVRAALDRASRSLDLSQAFFDEWNRAADHTQQQMREYSRQMDQIFSGYLQSMRRPSSAASSQGRDMSEEWATMMRGGEYGEDPATGNRVWITNEYPDWWINSQGVTYGSSTGSAPATNDDWRKLVPRGQ